MTTKLKNIAVFLPAILLGLSGAPLLAQEGESIEEAETIEEVVTIGTRVKGRTATETPSPVDIISAEAFRMSGRTETGQLLQTLAPSFNFSSTTISDGTDLIRPATLRGLGVDQVLVLVNGKRRHQTAHVNIQQTIARGSAGTDINAIPASSIARIEVLRDGAAAQYGSDAIAGIINIILKDDVDRTEFSAQYGEHFEGDGDGFIGSINTGFPLGGEGFANFTFEYRDRGETNRAGPATTNLFGWYPSSVTDADLQNGTVTPEVKLRIGDAESENIYFFGNAAIPVGNGELYAFGGYSNREGDSSGFFRGPEDNRTIPTLYPNGFLPNIVTELTDWSIAAGYRGELANDWDWDLSIVLGESEFDFSEQNTANVSWWFEPTDPTDPLCAAPRDPACAIFAASPTSGDTGDLLHDQTTINLDFRGVTEYGNGKSLNIATGVEYREDGYEIKAGDPVSYTFGRTNDGSIPIFGQDGMGTAAPATQGFPGFSPTEATDSSRDNVGIYFDLESYVSDRFLLGGAVRYEDYSDFGDALTGKLSGLFEATDNVSFRGTVSTGFRAPGVQQTFFSQKSTNLNAAGVLTDTLNGSQAVANALGFAPLMEEESTSYSVGIVAQPNDAWTLTLDVYRIDVDDRIVFSSSLEPEGDLMSPTCQPDPVTQCPIAVALAPLNVAQANIFTNAVDTETTGMDFVAEYTHDFPGGSRFDFQGILHINDTNVEAINPSSTILTPSQLFDDVQVTLIEEGQPGERIGLIGTYYRGPWTANVTVNWYGEVTGKGFTGTEKTWGAKTLVDLAVAYDFTDAVRLTIGGTNIFDEFPDKWGSAADLAPGAGFSEGGFIYCWETCPFGINGGYYYSRLDFRFGH